VVIPTFNERENLPILVSQLMQLPAVRVLVVDDDSPDGTGQVADGLAATFTGRVEVLHRTGRRGLGSAYIEGMQRALTTDTDLVAQMDADLSHDVRYLPDLIAASATADLVIGSRYVAGGGVSNWPLNRRLLSRFANIYVRVVTGLRIEDARLTHLAYAPEIAGAMLRRQQAEAIIGARKQIVLGAVSMVEMALNGLTERGVVELDAERRAQMVSNLLVVLCAESEAQPVINAGTLYG